MSLPCEPDHVKLIASLFSPRKEFIDKAVKDLSGVFGRVDWSSPEIFFDRTRYYEREMGWPLHRRFISFEDLVPADSIAEIKLKTNEIERQYLRDEKREINIDPGYISPERLILATGKNYVHRVYLSGGIYADLTLVFKKGSFRELQWTYPDYRDPKIIEYFNGLREQYMKQLREIKSLG